MFPDLIRQNRRTLALAGPIMAGQVGQMLMGWADTIMVGHLGILPLAACAFANTVVGVFMISGFGLLSGVTMRASQAHGAGQARETGEVLRAGVMLSMLGGVAIAALIHLGLPLTGLLGQPPEVVRESWPYLLLLAWSLPAIFVASSAKGFSESLSRPWIPFWIMMGGVVLNVGLNWIFIFGHWGVSAMGLTGAGIATLLARIATALALPAWIVWHRAYAEERPHHWLRGFRWSRVGDLVRVGLPVGTQLLCEVGAFSVAALLMGWIGVNALAAHQIALTCASTTFMFPLGLSMALTVRVGQAVGAGDHRQIRPIALGGVLMAIGIMGGFAVLFLTGGAWIARWFVEDTGVALLAAKLLVIAGLFQVFDGMQVTCAGALRGLSDVHYPMLINLVAWWIVGLPLAYFLAFVMKWRAFGVWVGLAGGLAFVAAVLALRLRKLAVAG